MKVRITLFTIIVLLPIWTLTQAAESRYFEFAPNDSSEKFSISRRGEIIQPFIASNDFISGIDLWLDNSSAGNITISLLTENNQILSSKTVSVPIISPKWAGERFHITFNQPSPTSGNQIYKIKITNASTGINIYYANRIQTLEHNSPYSPLEKIILPAIISGVEQDFATKFALYDSSSDTLPPTLSNISSIISSNAVFLKFNANEPVDFKIIIESADKTRSQTEPYKNGYFICNQAITTCNSVLNIPSNASYSYQISAKDQWNNQTDISGIIGQDATTTANPQQTDKSAPIISNIRVSSLNQSSAIIAWTTNEPANSSVLIGLNEPNRYQIITSVGYEIFELEHTIDSGNILQPNTNYFASIMSIDLAGNISNQYLEFTTLPSQPSSSTQPPTNLTSPDQTVHTLATTSSTAPPPQVQNILNNFTPSFNSPQLPSPSITSSKNNQIIEINWPAPLNEPSNGYRIDIFDVNYNFVKKFNTAKGNHNFIINNLPSGKYKAIIYADNKGTFEKVAKPADFTIPSSRLSSYKNFLLYTVLFILLAIIAGVIYFIQFQKRSNGSKISAFTLIELLTAIGVSILITLFLGYFIKNIFNYKIFLSDEIVIQQELQQAIQTFNSEARSMKLSALGDYPIAEAASSSLTFFSDIDGDNIVEKVRYFASGTILKKSVTKPSGNPLTYNPVNQIITELVHNLNMGTSTIFSYYDADYSDSEPKMLDPINILLIREIGLSLSAGNNETSSQQISIKVTPRNLRTNL